MNDSNHPSKPASPRKPNIRSVILPAEHGAWAALIEAILMGFLVSFTWQSIVVAINAILLGLCLQPCKIVLRGPANKYQIPRYKAAKKAFAILAPLSTALLIFNVLLPAISPSFALVLLVSVPMVLIHWVYESNNQPRHLLAVLSGMLAITMVAPAMAAADAPKAAFVSTVLLILAARQISSISYARHIVRKSKGLPAPYSSILTLHLIGLMCILLIPAISPSIAQSVQIAFLSIYAILCFRTIIGLVILKQRGSIKPKILGLTELAIGIIYVISTSYLLKPYP
ncbi:YwiC-like family protein [Planctomycetota bacterium]|nr:YwiC-like family protein [Planctomycetota bacterium]